MEILLARQPILDAKREIHGYELLFRKSEDQSYQVQGPSAATLSVIGAALLHFGLHNLVGPRMAFINFTPDLLHDDFCLLLPARQTVIEILEDAELDPPLLERCRQLRAMGFRIALDDVAAPDRCQPFEGGLDYIKVDFLSASPDAIEDIASHFKPGTAALLAEKIETVEDFHRAQALGFTLFQGFFFERPELFSQQVESANAAVIGEVLREARRPFFDPRKMADLLKREPVLTLHLLRLANSACMGLRQQIASVEQAILLLGQDYFKRWVMVSALALMSRDNITLVHQSVQRARLAELLAPHFGIGQFAEQLFLSGLFLHCEALSGMTPDKIAREFNFAPLIKDTLLGLPTPLTPVLRLAEAIEHARFEEVTTLAAQASIPRALLSKLIAESYAWVMRLEL